MKATAPTFSADPDLIRSKSFFAILMELVKARLTLLVILTTVVGFYLGSGSVLDYRLLFFVSTGTSLLAAGAAVLNQVLEIDYDARMKRTADRPLPSGRVTPGFALLLGSGLSLAGLFSLLLWVNALTAVLGGLTWLSYVALYTPLKRITVLNTLVGAVPGALPPLMGWSAATNSISAPGWSLFGILFFWQLPHFMAIAWLYREDYAGAGFKMLSGADPDGRRTAASAVRNTLALLAISLFPFQFGVVGKAYLIGSLVCGLAFLTLAIAFAKALTPRSARQLFFASILYLPLLLGLLVVDKRTSTLTSRGQISPNSQPVAIKPIS